MIFHMSLHTTKDKIYWNTPYHILAIDPGPHIGIVVATYEPVMRAGEHRYYEITLKTCMKMWDDNNEIATRHFLWDLGRRTAILAYESFALFGHKAKQQTGSSFPTVEVIGALKMLSTVHDFSYRSYPPSMVSNISNDYLKEKLQTDELPPTTHERSALRVWFTYLLNDFKRDIL